MNFDKDLKKVMILYPEANVQGRDDYRELINIHNVAESAFKDKLDYKIVIAAFDSRKESTLKNANDYYYLLFKAAVSNKGLTKLAYPAMLQNEDIKAEFDIDKWAGLVYKIYDAVNSGSMNVTSAIDYYAKTLDSETSEDENFKRWVSYFQRGDHMKYNSEEEPKLKKDAFQFPLSGPGGYAPDNATLPADFRAFKRDKEIAKAPPKPDQKSEYLDWRSKLYSAIRRIDKLLRQSDNFVDQDTNRDLAELLHHFDQEVRNLKHQVTAADLSYKYANKFMKAGSVVVHDQLMKYAQDMTPEANAPDELSPELENREDVPEPAEESSADKQLDQDSLTKAFSGRQETEGSKLMGDNISLNDAVVKLEEVAGRLSDRRTIRMLAEFDIMLDNIGVASMFPELAEAQSKLIDGYSYALTRVTRMLGMLASGKSLVEISDAKKKDLTDKTRREVDKVFEGGDEQSERGAPAIQKGLDEAEEPVAPSPELPETPEI